MIQNVPQGPDVSEHDLMEFLRPYRRLTADRVCQTPIGTSQVVVWTFQDKWRRAELKKPPQGPGSWCQAYLRSVLGLDNVQYELAKKQLFSQTNGLNGIYKHRSADLYAVVYRPAAPMRSYTKAAIVSGVALAGVAGVTGMARKYYTSQNREQDQTASPINEVAAQTSTSTHRLKKAVPVVGEDDSNTSEALLRLHEIEQIGHQMRALIADVVAGRLEVESYNRNMSLLQAQASNVATAARTMCQQPPNNMCTRIDAYARLFTEAADVPIRQEDITRLIALKQQKQEGLDKANELMVDSLCILKKNAIDVISRVEFPTLYDKGRLAFLVATNSGRNFDNEAWLKILLENNFIKKTVKTYKLLFSDPLDGSLSKLKNKWDENHTLWNDYAALRRRMDPIAITKRKLCKVGRASDEACSILREFKTLLIDYEEFPDTSHNKLSLSQDDHALLGRVIEDLKNLNFSHNWPLIYQRWYKILPYLFDAEDTQQIQSMIKFIEGSTDISKILGRLEDLQRHFRKKYQYTPKVKSWF